MLSNEAGNSVLTAVYEKNGKFDGSQDLSLEPIGTGLRDFNRWMADGWEFKMVDPVEGPHSNPVLAALGMRDYSKFTDSDNPITEGLEGLGVPWHTTQDYLTKIQQSASLRRLVDIMNSQNPMNRAIIDARSPYVRTSGHSRFGWNFVPAISTSHPVFISSTSSWTSPQIATNLGMPALSNYNIQTNSIPYSATLSPSFYQNMWAGNIKLDSVANLEFHNDRNINDAIKGEWITKVARLNDISKKGINMLRSTIGYGYGHYTYAIWDGVDILQQFVPGPGMRVTKLTTSSKMTPHAFYNTIYQYANVIDNYWSPFVADQFIRGWLSPAYMVSDPGIRANAISLYYNWRDISGRTAFINAFGSSQNNWQMFENPSNLGFVNSFANSLEYIAYLNSHTMPFRAYTQIGWESNRNKISGVAEAMNQLAWIYSGSTSRTNLFSGHSSLNAIRLGLAHLPNEKAMLINILAQILAEPWRLASHPLSFNLNEKINTYVNYAAPNFYNDFIPNSASWVADQPLFLSEFGTSLKPFFGQFGQISSIPIQVDGITTDIGWNPFSRAESDYLNSMLSIQRSLTATAVARPWLSKIYGAESVGEHNLHPTATVQHYNPATGTWHYQYGDFVQLYKAGGANFFEIYGDRSRANCELYDLKTRAYLINRFPLIYSPTSGTLTNLVFKAYLPSYLFRTSPSHDSKTQGELFQKIVGEIISASIVANPTNPNNWLQFHEVLFGMRVPQNMQNWGIYNYFGGSHTAANEWVKRIQFIYGIHVDSSTLDFDYIINNPSNNLVSADAVVNVPHFNPAVNVVDPDYVYNQIFDPWNSYFDPSIVSGDLYDVENNFKYVYWKGYFSYLGSMQSGFSQLMYYLYLASL